jgi:hypothetical protein
LQRHIASMTTPTGLEYGAVPRAERALV